MNTDASNVEDKNIHQNQRTFCRFLALHLLKNGPISFEIDLSPCSRMIVTSEKKVRFCDGIRVHVIIDDRLAIYCGGEVVVLGTRLISGNAHGCCPLHVKEGKEPKEVLEAEDDEEKESEVDREVEERERVNVCMRHEEWGTNARHFSHSVMCEDSNEDDTKETLQYVQRALTSLELLFL